MDRKTSYKLWGHIGVNVRNSMELFQDIFIGQLFLTLHLLSSFIKRIISNLVKEYTIFTHGNLLPCLVL